MKLRHPIQHPEVVVRLRLPGELAHLLERYRAYQTDTTHVEWDVKDLLTAMLRAFLEEGDRDFGAWCKAHEPPPATPPPSRPGNGATPPRRATPE